MAKVEYGLGDFRLDQHPAQNDAQDDGADREPFNPAVSHDELLGRQQLCEDAVFGRRIGGGADADNRIGQERVAAEKHQKAAAGLDEVREEHHASFGH